MTLLKQLLAISFISIALISGFACESEGPMEETGEQIDEALEETGDEVEDAGDELEEGLDQ